MSEHCEWDAVRLAAAEDEQRAMQALAVLLLTMVAAGIGFVLCVVLA